MGAKVQQTIRLPTLLLAPFLPLFASALFFILERIAFIGMIKCEFNFDSFFERVLFCVDALFEKWCCCLYYKLADVISMPSFSWLDRYVWFGGSWHRHVYWNKVLWSTHTSPSFSNSLIRTFPFSFLVFCLSSVYQNDLCLGMDGWKQSLRNMPSYIAISK